MRIDINNKGKNIQVVIPTCLLLSPPTALIASAELKKEGVSLSPTKLMKLFAAIRKCRSLYPGWKIVEVTDSSGEEVVITL